MNQPPPNPPPRSPGFTPSFSGRATTIFRCLLASAAGLVAATGYAIYRYYRSPYWNGVGLAPGQPVLFSHRHHAGELRIDCRFCHASVETSAFAGMPATQTCLNCHSQIFTDTAMLRPVILSAETGEPLRWSRVTRLPDHVYFNHSIHLAKGVSCITCHGEVGRMALTRKAESLDMRWCLDCHRDPGPRLQASGHLFAAVKNGDIPAGLAMAADLHTRHLTNCSTCHH